MIEVPPEPCVVLGVRLHPADAFAVLGRRLRERTGRSKTRLTADFQDRRARVP